MASTNVVREITEGMMAEIAGVLGPAFQPIPYVYDVSKNNFKQSMSKYGVRPLATFEINGVVRVTTHQHSFQVVLTEGYIETSIGDARIQTTVLDLFDKMNIIYKKLETVKAGVPLKVLNVTNLVISEPEILEQDKVLVLKATIDILYRIELY